MATDLFGNLETPLKYLVNVNVLTTGFDAPNVDCVVLLRPTASPGLYYQMVGRGFRLHPDKHDCLVLDFGGNIIRHGPVDSIQVTERSGNGGDAPAKECPECQAVIHAAYAVCPDCGFEFPPPKRNKHETRASSEGILSGEVTDEEFDVQDVSYSVHIKRDAAPDTPKTMRVDYRLGLNHWQSEWVCIEHSGYPFIQSGQDQGLLRRFKSAKLRRADPIQHEPRPSYIYRWYTAHAHHISAMGDGGYERLAEVAADRIDAMEPAWDRDWNQLAEVELAAAARPA